MYQNNEAITVEIWFFQRNPLLRNYTQIYLLLRHFNKFHFSHASLPIKVSN